MYPYSTYLGLNSRLSIYYKATWSLWVYKGMLESLGNTSQAYPVDLPLVLATSCAVWDYPEAPISLGCFRGLQHPLNKEHTLNHIRDPTTT